jgi:CheY-like chemotaxis protein
MPQLGRLRSTSNRKEAHIPPQICAQAAKRSSEKITESRIGCDEVFRMDSRAAEAGYQAYLVKPVSMGELLTAVTSLAKRAARRTP